MSRLLRRQALSIFRAALAAADPVDAVVRYLRGRDFSRFRHIYVIGAGKAGASMAQAAERVLGRRITAGLVNVKYGSTAKLRRIELNPCGHPLPDEPGVAGAERIAEIASQAGDGDLVVCLISGGGSALLPLPAAPITLAEKQATTGLLLACGANIHEINAVRKHLSRIKGGQLARLAAPAAVDPAAGTSRHFVRLRGTRPGGTRIRPAATDLADTGRLDGNPTRRNARGVVQNPGPERQTGRRQCHSPARPGRQR